MRWIRPTAVLLGLSLLAVPMSASIKAMSLHEYMQMTAETLHGTILSKETFKSDFPEAGTVYTRVVVEGDAWRSERPMQTELVYMGSHDPKDRYFMSEMPEFRDVRLGGEIVVFWGQDESIQPGRTSNVVWNLANVYRVERGFGEPVVIGKGEGSAFPENVKLSDARSRIKAMHALIEAEHEAHQHGDK